MAVGNQSPSDLASDFATLQFIIQQMLSRVQTLTLVRIVSCSNNGGVDPVGTVVVQPLVNLMSGDNIAFPHKPLYNLPYLRLQGGTNAIIIDPKAGDIGLAGFCSRDISAVKNNKDSLHEKGTANPGSFRQFSMADGIYIGGCLNGVPEQTLIFNDDGIKALSPTAITLQAPTVRIIGRLEQSNGDVTIAQDLTVSGDATVDGDVHSEGTVTGDTDVKTGTISLSTHTHSAVTTGTDVSGPPVP